MKKTLLALCLLVSYCHAFAQTATPYYTGFDDAAQQAGWQTFKKGNTVKPGNFTMTAYAGCPSSPNAAGHEYPFGGSNPAMENWFVSPMFDFSGGGNIDTVKVDVFAFLGLKAGDEFSIYLLNGSPDPSVATVTLLANLTKMANSTGVFKDTFNFAIPPTTGNSYIAFKYMATNNWFSAFFDDLRIDAYPYCAPTAPATIVPLLTSATINWTAMPGVLGYEYVLDNNPADPTIAGIFTTNTSVTPSGFSSSTTYYLHLRAICSANSKSAWTTQSFNTLTPPQPCLEPDNFTLSDITSNSVKLNWTTINNSKGYEIMVKESPSTPTISGSTAFGNTNDVNNLKSGTKYYAFIRTRCDGLTGFIFSKWISQEFFTHFPASVATSEHVILEAYPNPVNDILSVSGTTTDGQVILTDMNGSILQSLRSKDGITKIDMQTYPVGMYILQYTSGSYTTHIKVNKQ